MFFVVLFSLCLVACVVAWIRTHNSAWRTPALVFGALIVANLLSLPGYVHATIVALGLIAVCVRIQRHRNKRTRFLHLVGLTVVVAALVYSAVVISNPFVTPAGTPDKSVVKALTVLKPDRSCKKSEFSIGALKSVNPDGRQRPDATSTPFDSADPTEMVGEVKTAVCTDPLYGAQVMNFFANLKLGSFKVVSANPWLNDFKGTDAATINAAASKYVALRDKKHPTKAEVAEMSKLENEWRTKANLANALLDRFGDPVVRTGQPALSYHLLGTGSVISGLPAVALNDKQQTRSSLQLTLTPKGESNCVTVVGFDITTKDLGQYPCPS